jgi:Plavaka transposase
MDEAKRLRALYKINHDDSLSYGLLSTMPFTERHPYSEICECLAPDLLHQVTKCFYDYVHEWLLELVTVRRDSKHATLTAKEKAKCPTLKSVKGEFDARFSHLPPYPSLRQFRKGLSCTSRWTGNEFRNMIKVYVGVVHGLVPEDASRLVKTYLDIHRLSSYISHTKDTLEMLDMAIAEFWKILMNPHGSFIKFGIMKPGWHAPKLHYLRHYSQWVRQHGALPYCSTDRTETWHKPLKASYRASNKGAQAIEFILRDESRSLAWAIWEQRLRNELILHVEDEKDEDDNMDKGMERDHLSEQNSDTVDAENGAENKDDDMGARSARVEEQSLAVWRGVTERLMIMEQTKMRDNGGHAASFTRDGRRWIGVREAGSIASEFPELEKLPSALWRFKEWVRLGRKTKVGPWRPTHGAMPEVGLTGYISVKLQYPAVHDRREQIYEAVRSQDRWAYGQNQEWIKSRFDTILLCYDKAVDDMPTMHHRRVARVLCFFSVDDDSMDNPLDDTRGTKVHQLAFVQMYETVGKVANPVTGMYRVRKMQHFEVVEIDTIERGVHLIPYYKNTQTRMANESSQPALDEYEEFWVNNQIDIHMYNSIY